MGKVLVVWVAMMTMIFLSTPFHGSVTKPDFYPLVSSSAMGLSVQPHSSLLALSWTCPSSLLRFPCFSLKQVVCGLFKMTPNVTVYKEYPSRQCLHDQWESLRVVLQLCVCVCVTVCCGAKVCFALPEVALSLSSVIFSIVHFLIGQSEV